jgi:Ca2+-dependent lipid-binding protein
MSIAFKFFFKQQSLILLSLFRILLESDASPKPDPLCVVFNHPFGRGWQEYARTETQRDVFNPEFHNKIKIHYCFEEEQKLKFQMFDTDSSSHSLSKHTYVGKVQCTLADIVTVQDYSADIMLNGVKRGQLIISATDVSHNRKELELIFSASHLRKSGLSFSFPDPFLDILSSKKTLIQRTKFLSNIKNPVWPSISVPFRVLRNSRGDYRQLTLQCYHHCKDGHHQLLGEAEIHARQLLEAPASFPLKKSVIIFCLF